MWRKMLACVAGAVGLLAALAGTAVAGGKGVVLVAHNGQGAYEGFLYGSEPDPDPLSVCGVGSRGCTLLEQKEGAAVVLLATKTTLVDIGVIPKDYCYDPKVARPYDVVGLGSRIALPGTHLTASGYFHRSGALHGRYGGFVTMSGQISGNNASGTFSLDGRHTGSYSCPSLNLTWRATFDATAQPEPYILGK